MTWAKLMHALSSIKYSLANIYLRKYRTLTAQQPQDSEAHYELSRASARFGLYNFAHAELKNAEYLNLDSEKIDRLNDKLNSSLPDLLELDVNQYQRFKILQTHLSKLLNKGESILDIGGGHGILSQFMPDNRYFLVEPSANGISGLELPFPDNSFDAVVTCHVFEHIVAEERPLFIDELLRVASKYVLIFNPFKNDKLDERERLKLFIDVTNSDWAKEHLECGLPGLEETRNYLLSKNLAFNIEEYGDIYTSVATVFMTFFASKTNKKDLIRINKHLNSNYDQLSRSKYPTNILLEITK